MIHALPMRTLAERYLDLRRSMGFQLKTEGQLLLQFADYVDRSGHSGPLTEELALRWSRLPSSSSRRYQARRLEVVRCFARHIAAMVPGTEVPGSRLLGPAHRRRSPYIFTARQIRILLHAAEQLGPVDSLRPLTCSTLIGLLACTGLRISEALRLQRDEVDIERGVLLIRQTKFRKSRLVPMHPSTSARIRRYATMRDERIWAKTTTFFVGSSGGPLPYSTFSHTFRGICRRQQWPLQQGARTPRIHDLRHTFAVQRLLMWYEQGIDVAHTVASLSTYLGHGKVTDTYWYLTGTPELMAMAAKRFERSASSRSGGDHEQQ